MSPDCRSLSEYVAALIDCLGAADASALVRLRQVVGGHRARIALDGEAIEVAFEPDGQLIVRTAPSGMRIDGDGATDTATVLALLDGHLEVNDAILDGRLRVTGSAEAVASIFLAIEILLDASSRSVGLQAVARQFRADPCREPPLHPAGPYLPRQAATWSPEYANPRHDELLRRLDLLADPPVPRP